MGGVDNRNRLIPEVIRIHHDGDLPKDAQPMQYGLFIFVKNGGASVIILPDSAKKPFVFSEQVGLKELPRPAFCMSLVSDGQRLALGPAMSGSAYSIFGGERRIGTNNQACYEVCESSGHVAYVVFPLPGEDGDQGFFVAQNMGLDSKEDLRLYHRFGYGPNCSVRSLGDRWDFRRTRT